MLECVERGIDEADDFLSGGIAETGEPLLSSYADDRLQFRVFARDASEAAMLRNLVAYVEAWRKWRNAQRDHDPSHS